MVLNVVWTAMTSNLILPAFVPEQHSFVFYKLWPLRPTAHKNVSSNYFKIVQPCHLPIVCSRVKFPKKFNGHQAWGNLKNSELVVLQDADIFFFIISGVALSVCIQRKKRSKLGGHTEPLFREYYTIQLTIFAIICWLKQLIV